MVRQSYQKLSRVIAKDLIVLDKLGIKNIEKITLRGKKENSDEYFWYRKNKHPKLYERLTFDTNGHMPFSETLGDIIMDFMISGFLDYERNIRADNIKKYFEQRKDNNTY